MTEVDEMVGAAARVVAGERSCWLVTRDRSGLPSARPMGSFPFDFATCGWTLRFLVDRRSGKASDVTAEPCVTVLYQDAAEAYVALIGSARLVAETTEVAARWTPAFDRFFPPGGARENAAFLEVEVSAMHLWIRGVTPEPFGTRTTELRLESGRWVPGTPSP